MLHGPPRNPTTVLGSSTSRWPRRPACKGESFRCIFYPKDVDEVPLLHLPASMIVKLTVDSYCTDSSFTCHSDRVKNISQLTINEFVHYNRVYFPEVYPF